MSSDLLWGAAGMVLLVAIYLWYATIVRRANKVREALARGEAVPPSAYYFRTAVRFTTGAPAWAHLNGLLALAVGGREGVEAFIDEYFIAGGKLNLALQILALRQRQAALMGHASYAGFKLADTMAQTPTRVWALLDDVWQRALPAMARERVLLQQAMAAAGASHPLQAWDWRHWAERVRQARYALDDAELKPYFPLDRALDGLFAVTNALFGITFRPAEADTWHPDVRYYEVVDANGNAFAGVKPTQNLVVLVGLQGAHGYPHWFELAPDHARWYPFYAKCVELDIPIQLQVGQSMVYDKSYPRRSVGRPITLDSVACDFPELKLVGIHVGIPWTDEMIAMAWKHANVYIGCDAHRPTYWPESFVKYINSFGQDKVLFGTDFPVLPFEQTRKDIEALGLKPQALKKLLRDNAAKLYKL